MAVDETCSTNTDLLRLTTRKKLLFLSVCHSRIDGESLVAVTQLPNLRILHARGLTKVKSCIDTIMRHTIEFLDIEASDVDLASFRRLACESNLEVLDVNDTVIRNQDVQEIDLLNGDWDGVSGHEILIWAERKCFGIVAGSRRRIVSARQFVDAPMIWARLSDAVGSLPDERRMP